MKPPNALAAKDRAAEEWIDLHFFRPIGYRLARRLAATRITADQVTLASLVIGLAAGHLFLYDDWRIGLAGLALLIVSDTFDSADGQLARLRGNSTRLGRTLDGISDNLRFLNLYAHLLVRLLLDGAGWPAVLLMVAAGLSHSIQAAAADFIRQAYVRLSGGAGSELDLVDDLPEPSGGFWRQLAARSYRSYVRRQGRLFPDTVRLVREWRGTGGDAAAAAYESDQRATVRATAWIGQNIRFAVLAVTAVPGWPAGYFWVTVIPLNLALLTLRARHEQVARQFLPEPQPVTGEAHAA